MADVKWIKLNADIFEDDKMCILETCEQGIAYELIWIKILCLAGKCNQNGYLMLGNGFPYDTKTIAKIFRLDLKLVEGALNKFIELGMMECTDAYMVSNWLLHQNEKGLEDLREQSRARQKKYRENQKKKASNVTSDVTDNVTPSKSNSNSDTYKEIIDYLNEALGSKYQHTTGKTQRCIKARLNEGFTVDDFKVVIDTMAGKWLKDNKMRDYLRPETLFGTKFESYLNLKGVEKNGLNKSDAGRTNEDALNYWSV